MNDNDMRFALKSPDFKRKSVHDFFNFCVDREYIRIRRERGDEPPWSDDPVFDHWRFCNVFREDDRTTKWFRDHIRNPLAEDYRKVLNATLIFRRFNRINTGEYILPALTTHQDLGAIRTALIPAWLRHEPLFTGAFLVRSPNGYDKLQGTMIALEESQALVDDFVAKKPATCEEAHNLLTEFPMLAGFQANQIVADLRYTCVLRDSADWHTWACAGPGTMRGLAWISGTLMNRGNPDQQAIARTVMNEIAHESNDVSVWPWAEARPMAVIDVSHALCEFDKYWRVKDYNDPQKRGFNAQQAFNMDNRVRA